MSACSSRLLFRLGVRVVHLCAFIRSGRRRRPTEWLTLTGVLLGFYVYGFKGVILGPLTVAGLQALLDIAVFVMYQPST